MARSDDFVTLTRQKVTLILQTLDDLRALRREWDSLDYANTLPKTFPDTNAEVSRAEVANVYSTVEAIDGYVYSAGRNTVLPTIRE